MIFKLIKNNKKIIKNVVDKLDINVEQQFKARFTNNVLNEIT